MEKNIIPINIIKSYVFDINKKVGQSQGGFSKNQEML